MRMGRNGCGWRTITGILVVFGACSWGCSSAGGGRGGGVAGGTTGVGGSPSAGAGGASGGAAGTVNTTAGGGAGGATTGNAGAPSVGGMGGLAAAGMGGSAAVTEETGTVTVLGSSLAVPQANYTVAGPRMGVADGDPAVKCTYYPNGLNGTFGPALRIIAGYWNWLDSQAQLDIYNVPGAEPFTRQDTYDELLTDQELLVYASLTNDDELNFYSYWYLYDPFTPLGTVYSTCTTTVTAFTESHVTGATDCMNLPASLLSLDHAPLGDPSPMATVSIEFDCPVTVDDGLPDPGGSGSACTGSATPCSLLSTFECDSTPGCFSSGDCGGVSTSCYSQFDQFSCSSQDGCYWSTSSDNCSGIASSCSSQFSEFSCGSQEGCSWSEDCSGSATPCSLLTAATCTTQPGCYLQ